MPRSSPAGWSPGRRSCPARRAGPSRRRRRSRPASASMSSRTRTSARSTSASSTAGRSTRRPPPSRISRGRSLAADRDIDWPGGERAEDLRVRADAAWRHVVGARRRRLGRRRDPRRGRRRADREPRRDGPGGAPVVAAGRRRGRARATRRRLGRRRADRSRRRHGMTRLDETLAAIRPLDRDAMAAAARPARSPDEAARQPRPARGARRLAGRRDRGRPPPPVGRRRVVIAAADHGVAMRQQVSAWPSEVTAQMVATFLAGRAAISTIAGGRRRLDRRARRRRRVADPGRRGAARPERRSSRRGSGPGPRDFTAGPAMTARRDRGRDRGRARRGRPGDRGRGASSSASARWGSATRPRRAPSSRR